MFGKVQNFSLVQVSIVSMYFELKSDGTRLDVDKVKPKGWFKYRMTKRTLIY